MNYFNTTQETGATLNQYEAKATNQDETILNFFRKHPGKKFTPFEVQNRAFIDEPPITSVRRSITNLTNKGKLIRTEQKAGGRYGRSNYLWTVKGEVKQLTFF